VTTVTPNLPTEPASANVFELAAVLTSPIASVSAWHGGAGTGLATTAVRIGPALLSAVPWPSGDLTAAVRALQAGDVTGCGRAIITAYGIDSDEGLLSWWVERLPMAPE
jgi:hypothetical protein